MTAHGHRSGIAALPRTAAAGAAGAAGDDRPEPAPFHEPIYVTRPLLPPLDRMSAKLREVWDARWLTNGGTQHVLLEKRLQEHLSVPYLSLFNNGTIALITAIQSLRLSGEVITTPFTFPATPHVLAWNGIRPIFCDIDPFTMTIDPDRLEEMITPQTTAILAVHVYGLPCDVVRIKAVADRYGLKVVYDGAHAFGTRIGGAGVGNFGDVTMFSFHATKLFHTAEGGALAFSDPNLKPRIDLLKNFGIKSQDEVVMPGINGKMNEIQAALGLVLHDYIDEEHRRREEVVRQYRRELAGVEGLMLVPQPPGVTNSCQYFVVRIDAERFGASRDQVLARLKRYNVFARKYFFPLCSDYACYRQIPSASPANLPVAQRVVREVLCLPLYGELTASDVGRICDMVASMQGRAG
jgi:dTDP-4-amino-4,6-dideoxygalactose transaminase